MPERNAELFNKIADAIEAEPHRHNQAEWASARNSIGSCGTTMCVAGWAVELSDKYDIDWNRRNTFGGVGMTKQGVHIEEAAYNLLGITYDEGVRLFAPHWMVYEPKSKVVQALRDIANGALIKVD